MCCRQIYQLLVACDWLVDRKRSLGVGEWRVYVFIEEIHLKYPEDFCLNGFHRLTRRGYVYLFVSVLDLCTR